MSEIPEDLVFLQWLIDLGYKHPKPIPGGHYACILPKMFTHAIIVGRIGDRTGYEKNFCYESLSAAKNALDAWDGVGEPVGWFREPGTGRRVSRSPDELDDNGKEIGAIGVPYVRW